MSNCKVEAGANPRRSSWNTFSRNLHIWSIHIQCFYQSWSGSYRSQAGLQPGQVISPPQEIHSSLRHWKIRVSRRLNRLNASVSNCKNKPVHPEKSHTGLERTCNLHINTTLEWNQEPFLWNVCAKHCISMLPQNMFYFVLVQYVIYITNDITTSGSLIVSGVTQHIIIGYWI